MSLCTSLMASGARASRALVRGPRVGRGARARLERLGGLPGRIATRPAPGAARALHTRDGGEGVSPGTARAAKPHGAPISLAHAGSRRFTVGAVAADADAKATGAGEARATETHPMFLHNTQTKKKERFVPRDENGRSVSMYVCGVTVYDYSHIGHARVYVAFDVLFRQLMSLGYDVTYVRNFTDVDDKIIARARENGETCDALVDRFVEAFREDVFALNCLPPSLEPRATAHMDDIIDMTSRLVEKGHAYETGDGDVYFAVDSLPSYGALSGRKPEDNRAGGSDRVAVDAKKKNPADFALWKAAKPGEPTWASPWGEGRPGWHIECSAMIEKCLGPSIDIHGGGMDLTFPHHENELAQSTAACGCGAHASSDASSDAGKTPFVKYWVHNGFVKVDSEKMSKSLGNFFTIREVTERYHPIALRWMLLGTHYRAPINYTRRALEEASDRLFYAYQTLLDAKRESKRVSNEEAATSHDGSSSDSERPNTPKPKPKPKPKPPAGIAAEAIALAAETRASVANALADDLNTPAATASLSAPLKTLNDLVSTKKGRKAPGREQALGALTMAVSDALSRVGMPCDDEESGETCSIPILESLLEQLKTLALRRAGLTDADVADAVARREAARAEKDFDTSDAIRDELKRAGVALMDGAAGAGTDWRPCAVEEAESE